MIDNALVDSVLSTAAYDIKLDSAFPGTCQVAVTTRWPTKVFERHLSADMSSIIDAIDSKVNRQLAESTNGSARGFYTMLDNLSGNSLELVFYMWIACLPTSMSYGLVQSMAEKVVNMAFDALAIISIEQDLAAN